MRFWMSWYETQTDWRAVTDPPPAGIIGYWCSGIDNHSDDLIICGLVEADSEASAWEIVRGDSAFPGVRERFCKPGDDWKPTDRFALSDWMTARYERTQPKGIVMDTNNETATGQGGWTTLAELPEGAVFETESGTRAVKSEYHYDNGACQCVLLDSGEYAHFCNDPGISPQATAYRHNATKVREIVISDDEPQGDAPATGQGGHTPEPWRVRLPPEGMIGAKAFVEADTPGKPYAEEIGGDDYNYPERRTPDLHRIVACVNACAGLADPAATIRDLREAVREEAGWVIERHINGELRYWCGRGVGDEMFLPNHLEAVRFGREQDAACVLAWCLKGYGRAAQHIWTDTTALRAAGGG